MPTPPGRWPVIDASVLLAELDEFGRRLLADLNLPEAVPEAVEAP